MAFNFLGWRRFLGTTDRAKALDKHQATDHAKENHVGKRDQQINLSDFLEVFKDLNTNRRTKQTAKQQNSAHLEINGFLFHMRKNAGKGRRHNLVRLGRNGNSRRDANEEKQWRHQEATTNAEHAGQNADQPAKANQQEYVHRHFGDRKINLHGFT